MSATTQGAQLGGQYYSAILEKFPPGVKIISATPAGISSWNDTYQLELSIPRTNSARKMPLAPPAGSDLDEAGQSYLRRYWMKVNNTPFAKTIVEGEFANLAAINAAVPGLAPNPQTWGQLTSQTPSHGVDGTSATQSASFFLLSEYVEFDKHEYIGSSPEPPPPDVLCKSLAALHMTSVSPNGLFGYPIPCIQGRVPVYFGPMTATWTPYFLSMIKYLIELDDRINGVWPALAQLTNRAVTHLIPRLLGVLESKGRVLKPSLLHGDFWEGNVGIEKYTAKVKIFDPASLWGHSELEIGNLRSSYNKLGREHYRNTYKALVEVDEPKEEWEDRNRLYGIYWNLSFSSCHADEGKAVRQMVFDGLYYLVDKFTPFREGEGPPRITDEERVPLSKERDHVSVKTP